ncbi:MAG: hypothetical protein ACXWWS_12550, partial [Candidatus Deferrimicrobiaceae bacterium]
KNRITWRVAGQGMETKGGVTYRGTSFEGVVSTETDAGSGGKMFQVKKVTGKRIGDAKNPVGRHYSPKRKDDEKGVATDNPVKSIRKRFGF